VTKCESFNSSVSPAAQQQRLYLRPVEMIHRLEKKPVRRGRLVAGRFDGQGKRSGRLLRRFPMSAPPRGRQSRGEQRLGVQRQAQRLGQPRFVQPLGEGEHQADVPFADGAHGV